MMARWRGALTEEDLVVQLEISRRETRLGKLPDGAEVVCARQNRRERSRSRNVTFKTDWVVIFSICIDCVVLL